MDNDKKSFKDKLKRITQKDAFYLVLFLCICIVGITAVWVSSDNFNQVSELKDNENEMDLAEDDNDIVDYYLESEELEDQQNPDTEDVDIEENTPEEKEKVEKNTNDENTNNKQQSASVQEEEDAVETVSSGGKQIAMLVPVAGKKSMGYSEDNLVYSETLEQWTTHNGLDIKAEKGTAVRTVLSGTVKKIETNDELGMVVTIDHGNNLETKYGCLSTEKIIEEGQKVEKGDPIGTIGEAEGYELAQGPHLHFEVLENGKNIDPTDYLPEF